MKDETKILNQAEALPRKKESASEVLEISEETDEEKAGKEKNKIELFSEEVKAENMAFNETIALVASLRKDKITEAKDEKQTILATAENLLDANQIKKEYEAVLQKAEGELVLAENFKQEAAKRLKILQDLDITSEADIRRLNFLVAEVILALTEAREQHKKSFAFVEQAQQLASDYTKIRLAEQEFHSREEVEEAAANIYQKQIRATIREIKTKKKEYKGLGRLINRKEIKHDSAELKRLRDTRNKLDDLLSEISTVGYPPAELVSKQRNVSIDINDLSKACGDVSIRKICYHHTELIKEIQFSESEVFNEKALGSPEEMYFAAYQEGIIPGSRGIIDFPENPKFYKNGIIQGARQEILDKAQHEKIAWFIKNTESMAKAREIIKSLNVVLKKIKNAELDLNSDPFLFNDALRNSALSRFRQYDEYDKVDFIKDINIELWNIYRDNEKAQEFFGQENIEATNSFLANEIIDELLKTEQHMVKSINFGRKLLFFPSADTAPVAVLNAYRESGYSGERPFLSIHHKSEESELFKFIMKLDTRQLKIIKQKRIPGLYEIITAIKANPTTFNSQFIKNPEITKFAEELKNDEEFLDYVQEQSFPPVKEYKISAGQVKNKETGEWEETRINYYPNENYCFIGRAYLKEILPDVELGADVISIKESDELFNKIKRALAKDSLKEDDIRPSAHGERGEFMSHVRTDEKYYSCPEEKIAYFLEKQNYSKRLFDNPEVYNPLYDEIQQSLVKMSAYYLKSGELDMKFYLMDLLEKLEVDLNGAYEEMAKILTGPPDYRLQKQIVDCLTYRIDKYGLCDKKALETILTGYDQALNVRKDIQQKTPQFINLLIREPYKFNQDEREYFGKLLSDVINCSPEEITRTVDFLIQIKLAGYHMYCGSEEDVKDYIALSSNSDMASFIQELLKDGFLLPDKKYQLQEIYENRVLILPAAKKLREYNIKFDLGRNFAQIKDIAENDLLNLFEEYKNKESSPVFLFIFEHSKELSANPKEKRKDYLEIFLKIDQSPSQEIQRLKEQLLKGSLEADNPIGAYEKINDIFVKNNLPTVGKIFKVFEVLHSPEEIKRKLSNGSPVLTQTKSKRRLNDIFYRDLLKIHIASGNRSLRQYCEILSEGEGILNEAENKGIDSLTYEQNKKLGYFFDKANTLFINSALDRNFEAGIVQEK